MSVDGQCNYTITGKCKPGFFAQVSIHCCEGIRHYEIGVVARTPC